MVKISTSNAPSLALFRRLGFGEVGRSEVWQEVEMRFGAREEGEGERQEETDKEATSWRGQGELRILRIDAE